MNGPERPLRVALADDQALVRAGLRALLERLGIEVAFEAEDGQGLLDALQLQPVDVVLSDIRMPGLDGIAALRELRDEGCTMLVSTHNLGSVSEFCDYTVMVKGTVLASGPTESTFTAENLELAFSGVLRHVVLSGAEERIITDDERPFISRRAAGGER